MDARNSANGVGAVRSGSWSVFTVNGPKCASTRDPPGKSMIISMDAIVRWGDADAGGSRLVLARGGRHRAGVGDLPEPLGAQLRGCRGRSRTARAVEHDPRVRIDVRAPVEPSGDVVERDAGRAVEVPEPVLELRPHVDHEVHRPPAERARALRAGGD